MVNSLHPKEQRLSDANAASEQVFQPRTRNQHRFNSHPWCLQGTSVPIAIPMGLREERDSTPDSPEEPGGIHAATFVPPHMLEQARSGALELTNSVHVWP
jgi:hypothetical protein